MFPFHPLWMNYHPFNKEINQEGKEKCLQVVKQMFEVRKKNNISKCKQVNNKKNKSCYSNKASKTSLPSPSLLPHCQGPPSRSLQPHHNNALKQRSVRSAPSIATHHPADLSPPTDPATHHPVSTFCLPFLTV